MNGAQFPLLPGFRLVSSGPTRAGEGTPARVVHPDPGLRMVFAPQQPIPPAWYQLELAFPPEGLVDVVVQFALARNRTMWLRLPLIARNQFLAHLRLESPIEQVTLVLTGSGRLAEPSLLRFERVGLLDQLAATARRGRDIFRRDGFGVLPSALNYLWRRVRGSAIVLSRGTAAAAGEAPYETWIRIFDEHPERDRARHEERLAALMRRPLVSILAELSSADARTLDRLARSVAQQIYPAWELIVAAPAQLQHEIVEGLARRGVDTANLRFVVGGSTVTASLNAALSAAQGDYLLSPAGMLLRPHALLDLAMALDRAPSAALIYCDEDCLDQSGRRSDWRFKPAWSPNLFEASHYLGQVMLMRRHAVQALGGWSEGADPNRALVSRLASSAEPHAIVHLAKLLAHGVVREAKSIESATRRVVSSPRPRVSLIIPTRDNANLLATCIHSIRTRTRYDTYEILIVDNGSVEEPTKQLFARLAGDPAIRILPHPGAFNFSALNNFAARETTGEILGLLNNDIEVRDESWLDEMVALAARPQVGCVGAKLIYPDGRIQHGGVVLGLYGVAGHAHRFANAGDAGYLGRLRSVQNVSAVTAACLLVRKSVFNEVGGLDENLAVAFNDVDFCLKVRAAGYLNLWTPFAELVHHESVSRGRDFAPAKAARFTNEYATMQQRWGEQLLNDPYYSPHLTYDAEDFSLRLR